MRKRERHTRRRRRTAQRLDPSDPFTLGLTQEEILDELEPTWFLWEDTTEDQARDDEAAA